MRRLAVILLLLSPLAIPAHALIFRGGVGVVPSGGALVQLQAINSGSTKTNVPFSIGVPLDVSILDGSHHLTATDGTNGALTCDETNRASDIGGRTSGTAQVRMVTLSCNIPSWPNGTDNITIAVAAGAPGSGTDITTSDLTTANFDLTATAFTALGTTETAVVSAAFANAGYVNATTPAVLGKWRGGGGIVTGFVVYIPFKNGGTADPLGLYGLFDVECYKAQTGAVNISTNPITACHVDLLAGNSFAEHTIPLATSENLLAYGISFAGGAGGTTTCTDWAATAPTQTLTFTNHNFPVTISIANPALLNITATVNNEVLADNQSFFLTTTGALPSHFAINTPYALTGKDLNTPSHELLTASTIIGGASVSTVGDTQSGTHTIWPMVTGTVAANSALFTSDSIGTVISDGTFYGVITFVTDSTHADVSIWRPKPGLSTMTSGNYHLLPINHPYGARVHFTCDWVNTATGAPLRVQNGNLYLGDAWNGGAFTGGPGPYIRATRLIPNYNLDVNPGLSTVNTTAPACPPNNPPSGVCGGGSANSQGNNPSAYGTTGTRASQFVCNAGVAIGSFPPDQQSSGDNGQIYMNPGWVTSGLFLYNSNGYQAIFQNVDHLASVPWNTISNTSGAYPLSNTNTYTWLQGSRAGVYTSMAQVDSWSQVAFGYLNGCWSSWPNAAHASNAFHVPYAMTGDWYILANQLNMGMALASVWSGCGGKGTDNQWMGGHGCGNDERSMAWSFMIQGELALSIPDSSTSTSTDAYKVLGGFTKTDAVAWLAAQWNSTGGGAKTYLCQIPSSFFECPGTKYSPGVYRTGAGPTGAGCPAGGTCNPFFTDFNTPDMRFLGGEPAKVGFETGYMYNVFSDVHELGMCDVDCQQTWNWYMQGQSSYITNTTDLGSPVAAALVEHLDTEFAPNNPCNWYGTHFAGTGGAPTWACAWKAAYVDGYIQSTGTGMARFPTGTITLSGTTGTITATMPASGYLGGGTAFYGGGFLFTYDGGLCQNITVTNATHFTCDVTAGHTFGATSYSNSVIVGGLSATSQWEIPQPAAGDSVGLEAAYLVANGQPGSGGFHFANIQYAGCLQANEYLGFPITATCNAIKAFAPIVGGFQSQSDPLTFNIVPR